jgi:hypothetical protein
MVQLERYIVFWLVYPIIELALLLPVATTTFQKAFLAMKIIKTQDDFMTCYIEREIYKRFDLQQIKKVFQNKKNR